MTETLNTFEEATPDTAHEEAMLAKGEALEKAAQADRPEWLPEKFDSPEKMAQAYAELERRLGSNSAEEDTEEVDETETTQELADKLDVKAKEVSEVLDNAGLDFATFQDEYLENGKLSDDAYKALDEAGFDRSLVDSWIKGQEALASRTTQDVFDLVGGSNNYQAMVQWASDALEASEIEAYNANVDSGDPSLIRFAVQGLAARYRSEVGTEPKLVQGANTTSSSGAFQSAAELTAAMRDPRYHNDPAYRKAVSDKLARSSVF
jgi:hypothetical protein